ncbi:reverse transcriptase domain-containing protein [Tanacetum coccineum]
MEPKKRTTRASPATTTTTTSVTNAQLKPLIDKGVANALTTRDADRSMNGDDSHNSGTGVRRNERVVRECTYPDFMKCQPLTFKDTKGVVKLTQWFEKMETMFSISNCFVENQIKFSTCTLLGSALTWWNSYVSTVGHDVAYAMTWADLKKKMTNKYYPRARFRNWRMFHEESDEIERYVSGFSDMIHGSVVASKPKTMQKAIEMATKLMDKKISTFAERRTKNKRNQDDNNNQAQQQPPKKQGVAIAYTTGSGERKEYAGTLPLSDCPKIKNQNHGNQTRGNGTKKRTTRASPATTTTTTTSITNAQLKALIDKGVADALAVRDADRSMNGDDSHNSGTGVRRNERVVHECTYPDFMKCQPLTFKGTDEVVELTQWFEKMETVFSISSCSVENQIKFSTCTLLGSDLTWWNSHVRTIGHDVAMFPEESDKIERYVVGLPDLIHRSVVASKPKTKQEGVEMATELTDKKIHTFAERQTENKRKQDDNNNQAQQQPPKKQGVAIAYTAGSGVRKEYARTLPSDCPKLKNQNHGNQTGGTGACGMVHALGGREINQDLNNMEDDTNA